MALLEGKPNKDDYIYPDQMVSVIQRILDTSRLDDKKELRDRIQQALDRAR